MGFVNIVCCNKIIINFTVTTYNLNDKFRILEGLLQGLVQEKPLFNIIYVLRSI